MLKVPLPPCSLVLLLTSIPLAPFPTMVAAGCGLWSLDQTYRLSVQHLSDLRPKELWREESGVRTWPGRQGQSLCGPRGPLEQLVRGPDHHPAAPHSPPALAQPSAGHLPSCSSLDDPPCSSLLALPALLLDPLVSRLPVPLGKGLFLTLQMPSSIKDKK